MSATEALAFASSEPPLASAPLSRFLRVPDPDLEAIHDGLWDLKQARALQCVFLAGCCHRARVAAGRMLPEGSRVAAPSTENRPAVSSLASGTAGKRTRGVHTSRLDLRSGRRSRDRTGALQIWMESCLPNQPGSEEDTNRAAANWARPC